jgi:hypothetical protein
VTSLSGSRRLRASREAPHRNLGCVRSRKGKSLGKCLRRAPRRSSTTLMRCHLGASPRNRPGWAIMHKATFRDSSHAPHEIEEHFEQDCVALQHASITRSRAPPVNKMWQQGEGFATRSKTQLTPVFPSHHARKDLASLSPCRLRAASRTEHRHVGTFQPPATQSTLHQPALRQRSHRLIWDTWR